MRSFLFIFFVVQLAAETLCLNMIVKNESKVIERCLASVKPIIDYWVIVDTGSTDGTQEIIRKFMKDVPGELHERPWVNFAHNRNEAMGFAKGKGDYLLFIDADEEFTYLSSFVRPVLKDDSYCILCDLGAHQYRRKLVVNNHLNWKWKGVVHELLECSEAQTNGSIPGIVNVIRMEGNRSSDPEKYKKDVALLEKAIETDPSYFNYFFLAQSYRDSGDYRSSIQTFKKAIELGKNPEENYWCYYQMAMMQDLLKESFDTVITGYCDAYQSFPSRAEPLYDLARYLSNEGFYLIAYHVCEYAMKIPSPEIESSLIFNKSVYEYGLLMEFARASYWLGKYDDAYHATLKVLALKNLPDEIRQKARANLQEVSAIWLKK